MTGSKPSHNPNPAAPKPSGGGVTGGRPEFTPDQKRQRQANQDQVLKYGAEHAGFDTSGSTPDENARRISGATNYTNTILSEMANPGDSVGQARDLNSREASTAAASGNPYDAARVRDTDAVIAQASGDNSPEPDYRIAGDGSDKTSNLVNANKAKMIDTGR